MIVDNWRHKWWQLKAMTMTTEYWQPPRQVLSNEFTNPCRDYVRQRQGHKKTRFLYMRPPSGGRGAWRSVPRSAGFLNHFKNKFQRTAYDLSEKSTVISIAPAIQISPSPTHPWKVGTHCIWASRDWPVHICPHAWTRSSTIQYTEAIDCSEMFCAGRRRIQLGTGGHSTETFSKLTTGWSHIFWLHYHNWMSRNQGQCRSIIILNVCLYGMKKLRKLIYCSSFFHLKRFAGLAILNPTIVS
jgi:hypothetical protein